VAAWRVAICGSSVAFGWRAHADQGWAARLAEALQRYGHQTLGMESVGLSIAMDWFKGKS